MFWRKKDLAPEPTIAVPEKALLGGVQEVCTVFALQEGYLLRIVNYHQSMPTVLYCRTAAEIGERLVAEQAKTKMGLNTPVIFKDAGIAKSASLTIKNVTT